MERAVLLVSDDDELVQWIQGHAAGHGVAVLRGHDELTRSWARAPLVLVGADALDALDARRPPTHPQVHVLVRAAEAEVGRSGSGRPARGGLQAAVRLGVRSVLGPEDADRLGMLLAAVADPRPPGRALAFLGARGGEGVSVLATAVALAASSGGTVALLQPDSWGPAPEHVLGARDPGSGTLTWHDVAQVSGVLTPVALRDGLPGHRGISVLAHSRRGGQRVPGPVLSAVVEGTLNAFDVVVVDLDVSDDDQCTAVLGHADRTWILTRPRALGLTAARDALQHLRVPASRARLMLRGTGVADSVAARTVGLDVAHRMPDDKRLDEALDLGVGPLGGRRTPLARAAAAVLEDLARPVGGVGAKR